MYENMHTHRTFLSSDRDGLPVIVTRQGGGRAASLLAQMLAEDELPECAFAAMLSGDGCMVDMWECKHSRVR